MSSPLLRWISPVAVRLKLADVSAALKAADFDGKVSLEEGTFIVVSKSGTPVLDMDIVLKGDPEGLFAEEVEEFGSRLAEALPRVNAERLAIELRSARCFVALAPYWAEDGDAAADALDALLAALRAHGDGFLHVLDEGFSNRVGDLLVWELPEDVDGEWRVALPDGDHWSGFTLNVEDTAKREAFLEGRRL
jgi:hypothetical protein